MKPMQIIVSQLLVLFSETETSPAKNPLKARLPESLRVSLQLRRLLLSPARTKPGTWGRREEQVRVSESNHSESAAKYRKKTVKEKKVCTASQWFLVISCVSAPCLVFCMLQLKEVEHQSSDHCSETDDDTLDRTASILNKLWCLAALVENLWKWFPHFSVHLQNAWASQMGTTNRYKVGQHSKRFDKSSADCKKWVPDTSGGNRKVQVLSDMLHLLSSL